MKKLALVVVGLGLCAFPIVARAGIQGGDHDLTGTGRDLCFACHIPHNALGAKLWAQTPSGTFTGVQDLCYTCHDGSVTSIGSATAFNATKQQHKAVGSDCSSTSGCHDVHNQNPNLTGKFTTPGVTLTAGNYCTTCHDATPFPGAAGLGDHTAGLTHFINSTTFTCNQCHTIHGATPQTTNPAGLTHPILLANNQPGAFYGAFCISCHNGTAPAPAAVGTGGVAATDVFDYAEATNNGTEFKHPTTSTTGSYPTGGCNKCHDVHDPTLSPAPTHLLMAANANSAYCLSCHTGGSAPGVGGNSHYLGVPANVNMNTGLTPPLPWANQINDDGNAGPDYPLATANYMACETCHSAHRNGFTGAGGGYFLRRANSTLNELCTSCHTGK